MLKKHILIIMMGVLVTACNTGVTTQKGVATGAQQVIAYYQCSDGTRVNWQKNKRTLTLSMISGGNVEARSMVVDYFSDSAEWKNYQHRVIWKVKDHQGALTYLSHDQAVTTQCLRDRQVF